MQKVAYDDAYYGLYFGMAGFDDMEYHIFKMPKTAWRHKERLNKEELEDNPTYEELLWNYDEGEKFTDNIHLFIKSHYLVMARGNLYFSLYDLDKQEVLVNEISPWAQGTAPDNTQSWIKTNLHFKIVAIIGEEE